MDAAVLREKLNDFFLKLPKATVKELFRKIGEESLKKRMIMFTDTGGIRVIAITIRPWVVNEEQKVFFHNVCQVLRSALGRLLKIYLKDEEARKAIPLTEKEEEWLHAIYEKGIARPQTIFDRLDANATFAKPDWRNFHFLEPNSVGAGGVHYIPITTEIIMDLVMPLVKEKLPDVDIVPGDDVRELLIKEVRRHAQAIGRDRANIAFIEDQRGSGAGTDEFENVVAFFKERKASAYYADPREIHLKEDELYFKDTPIDLIYRDSEIDELIEMEKEAKAPLTALRWAFINNRVISSMAGEFDHKSCWEVFTDKRFFKYFTDEEKQVFKNHIPWTRLIWERKTENPDGEIVDLVSYVRENKERLVIKPNRLYGGKEVTLGPHVDKAEWERMLSKALEEPSSMVAQLYLPIDEDKFPVLSEVGSVSLEDFFVVSGFASTPQGIAFLGRFSVERIVNVSRKGGLVPVMMMR